MTPPTGEGARRWAATLLTGLLAAALAQRGPGLSSSPALRPGLSPGSRLDDFNKTCIRIGGAWVGAYQQTGDALAELAALTLRAANVSARVVPLPATCTARDRSDSADSAACHNDTLAALAGGALHAALLPVSVTGGPPTWLLRDAGLEDLGDAAPLLRRTCLLTRPDIADSNREVRSLLELTDTTMAARYSLSLEDLQRFATNFSVSGFPAPIERCSGSDAACATILVADPHDAHDLDRELQRLQLRAHVVTAGAALANLSAAVRAAGRPAIVCDWTPSISLHDDFPNAIELGPLPCSSTGECAFDARRVVKYINSWELRQVPRARRVMLRFSLNMRRIADLTHATRTSGAQVAAQEVLSASVARETRREVRVGVLVPLTGAGAAGDALQLVAAATLAEEHADTRRLLRFARFKVEMYDDECSPSKAYKFLLDALMSGEYDSLSAVAGPACGASWADVLRQNAAHALPAIAYALQPALADGGRALLAAGEARAGGRALAALARWAGWRRVAAVTDSTNRAVLAAIRTAVDVPVHLELPDDPVVDYEPIKQWAQRAVEESAHVVLVAVESASARRAVLCAGALTGAFGASVEALVGVPAETQEGPGGALLLPAPLDRDALHPQPTDTHHCTSQQLQQAAGGYFSTQAKWAFEWENMARNGTTEQTWRQEWRAHCARAGGRQAECGRAAGWRAALLYDALRLWAGALDATLDSLAAVDELHSQKLTGRLVHAAVAMNFTGLTGPFHWSAVEAAGAGTGTWARVAPLLLMQWSATGDTVVVGSWDNELLQLNESAISWMTETGAVPTDGSEEDCAVQWAARGLGVGCGAAGAVLAAAALGALGLVLGVAALLCRRRMRAHYRRRLQMELGLHAFASKTVGLDKWELPRERVVINRKLGMGAFGTVYGGHAMLSEGCGWTAVAVKTLKEGATTVEKVDFLSEAEAMKRFDHKNIIKLLGVIMKTEPVCTVMEFMLYGDLKNYLLARRHLAESAESADEVSARRLTGMALDVARALSYLAQLRYVHRDVAARNCLVGASRVVKLADFGMTRLVFENDYYRFSRKGMLPVRWMAPESLTLGVFSSASDIWSFGILLYEIVTFGCLPYQGKSNSEVLVHVKSGRTLELPNGLKPRLEGLIKSCWERDAKSRPLAAEVVALLAESPRLLAPCVDQPPDALWQSAPPTRSPRRHPAPRADPASGNTDSTYLSADGELDTDAHTERDVFLS